ncbi:mammalian cell entry protein [Mycolicibacterium setense]
MNRTLASGLVVAALITVGLAGLGAWSAQRALANHTRAQQQERLVAAAKQGAMNLASIDSARVQDDVQRILDFATGDFLDEFRQRSAGFVDFVRKAQSKSEATIRAAGLESFDGHSARVDVAMTVKVTAPGQAPDAVPRSWRLRITVQDNGTDGAKISNVEFVP